MSRFHCRMFYVNTPVFHCLEDNLFSRSPIRGNTLRPRFSRDAASAFVARVLLLMHPAYDPDHITGRLFVTLTLKSA